MKARRQVPTYELISFQPHKIKVFQMIAKMIQISNLENSIHILTLKSSINFKLNPIEIKLNEINI